MITHTTNIENKKIESNPIDTAKHVYITTSTYTNNYYIYLIHIFIFFLPYFNGNT
jgi:hypothetical protein